MGLLVGEYLGTDVVVALREAAQDVVWVWDVCAGASDQRLLALAQETDRVLRTSARRFGKLAHMSLSLSVGVVGFRVQSLKAGDRVMRLLQMVPVVAPALASHFAIITSSGCRLRCFSPGAQETSG